MPNPRVADTGATPQSLSFQRRLTGLIRASPAWDKKLAAEGPSRPPRDDEALMRELVVPVLGICQITLLGRQ